MELQEAIQLLKTYIEKNESKHDKFVLGMAVDTLLREKTKPKDIELSQAVERLQKFDCTDCKFATCEQCEINYGDVQAIKIVLAELER